LITILLCQDVYGQSLTGWSLRDSHFSNGYGSFPLYVDFSFLYQLQDFYCTWLYE